MNFFPARKAPIAENAASLVLPMRAERQAKRAVSLMENAPWYVIYALHFPYCLYLSIRYRGHALPTIANPGLEASGLTRESKTDLYRLIGPTGWRFLPPVVTITTGPDAADRAVSAMAEAGFDFPAVAKPDIGRRGYGVRAVDGPEALTRHLARFPDGIRIVVQRYADGPGEAGIFYARMPSEPHGRILSLTLKHFPEVVGDGHSTVRELILRDRRAVAFTTLYFRRNQRHLDRVLEPGERHRLVSVGNHVQGAAFEDGSDKITPQLTQMFDTIAQEIPGFFIGRFDVRYRTLDGLLSATDFSIVEYNGASGEPTHIWDPRTSIIATYAGLLEHCRYLYAIGAENRTRGAKPITGLEILRRHFEELRMLRSYPDEE